MKGVVSMSRKRIYSNELKLKVVQRYLDGDISLKELSKEYYVGTSDIQKWRERHGNIHRFV